MITHYGLFWYEHDVFWEGDRSEAGKMLGQLPTNTGRRGPPPREERRDPEDFGRYKGIYSLHRDDSLIYIGRTGIENSTRTLIQRLRQHRTDHLEGLWNRFCWFGVADIPQDTHSVHALRQVEAIGIAIANPPFNKRGGGFAPAQRVLQVSHNRADKGVNKKIDSILAKIAVIENQMQNNAE